MWKLLGVFNYIVVFGNFIKYFKKNWKNTYSFYFYSDFDYVMNVLKYLYTLNTIRCPVNNQSIMSIE